MNLGDTFTKIADWVERSIVVTMVTLTLTKSDRAILKELATV